jgi:hypothetical protein
VNRALAAGVALLLLLAGCPLPQPLPSYPAGTVTPPRILMDALSEPQSVIQVPSGCSNAPSRDLQAELVDANTSETVTVRWFVDYDRESNARCVTAVPEEVLTGPGDQASNPTHRQVSPYHFVPYDHDAVLGGPDKTAPGVVHVVELVVSNRFDSNDDQVALCTKDVPEDVFPFRMPATQGSVHFETQTYRWVFVNVPESPTLPCP